MDRCSAEAQSAERAELAAVFGEPIENPLVSASQRFFKRVWLPVFAASQLAIFTVVSQLDPAGFDECDLTYAPGPRGLQKSIVAAGVVLSVALALWRVRGWRLLAAFALIALATCPWLILLGDGQNC
jgi:membrane-bound metal-dependent hydrolase YbcI (DUF457 family)